MSRVPCLVGLVLLAAVVVASATAHGEPAAGGSDVAGLPTVTFNQQLHDGLRSELDLEDVQAVFDRVFAQLPERARVYPTENYYYFVFAAEGRRFWGNLRLSPEDRDDGFVHFAYFDHDDDRWWRYRRLGPEDGVTVEPAGPLTYEVTRDGRSVTFELNPLTQEHPAGLRLAPGELFLGRAVDESGFQLLLLYDLGGRFFSWVLDEEQGVDWVFDEVAPDLHFHPSSAFVFFTDPDDGRRTLVGVSYWSVERNDYYDGPFDQLPDNHIAETQFAELVQQAYPYTRGLIDRRGSFLGESTRMAITPYREYLALEDLIADVADCRGRASGRDELYACLCRDPKAGLERDGGAGRGHAVIGATLTGSVVEADGATSPPETSPP